MAFRPSMGRLWQALTQSPPPPPPLRKREENQDNNCQTGCPCVDKAVLACDARYQKNVCHRKPVRTSP